MMMEQWRCCRGASALASELALVVINKRFGADTAISHLISIFRVVFS